MLKVLIDTNIWISALIATGPPYQLLQMWAKERRFEIVYPSWLLLELRSVESKPRILKRIAFSSITKLANLIQRDGELIEPDQVQAISRDPKDDAYLACALKANADFLVTGDDDLLCLKMHGSTQIVTVSEFLEVLRNQPDTNL